MAAFSNETMFDFNITDWLLFLSGSRAKELLQFFPALWWVNLVPQIDHYSILVFECSNHGELLLHSVQHLQLVEHLVVILGCGRKLLNFWAPFRHQVELKCLVVLNLLENVEFAVFSRCNETMWVQLQLYKFLFGECHLLDLVENICDNNMATISTAHNKISIHLPTMSRNMVSLSNVMHYGEWCYNF